MVSGLVASSLNFVIASSILLASMRRNATLFLLSPTICSLFSSAAPYTASSKAFAKGPYILLFISNFLSVPSFQPVDAASTELVCCNLLAVQLSICALRLLAAVNKLPKYSILSSNSQQTLASVL